MDSPAMQHEMVDPSPAPSRRSRKKSRTHAALVEAGAELFASQGFDETTTTDIAERADVSQRTLFRHFPSKEAVLYGDMDEVLFALRDALEAQPENTPVLAVVDNAITSLAENFETHSERRLLQARLAASYPSVSAYSRATVQLGWEREIIAAVASRLGVDPLVDPRPEIIAGATMSAVRIATRQWTVSRGTENYMTLISTALASVPQLGALAA
jgi:AcrR family transcriptional regulator